MNEAITEVAKTLQGTYDLAKQYISPQFHEELKGPDLVVTDRVSSRVKAIIVFCSDISTSTQEGLQELANSHPNVAILVVCEGDQIGSADFLSAHGVQTFIRQKGSWSDIAKMLKLHLDKLSF